MSEIFTNFFMGMVLRFEAENFDRFALIADDALPTQAQLCYPDGLREGHRPLLLIGGVAVGAATPSPLSGSFFALSSPFVCGLDAWIVQTEAALAGHVLTIKKMISLEKMRGLCHDFFRKACRPEAIGTPSNGIKSMTPTRFRMLLDRRISGPAKQFRGKIIRERHLMSPLRAKPLSRMPMWLA